ncbi:MAG: sigma-54 dependent transcriptional regulator [candidate division Zixibacteria bacterium]|nr:sigma-54 dependent transcriptional regulator [candidate division Zixibacteria bacterium]MDH3938514.1 sigma-54 dependent transcriptional regulator [candidate division Zixibacteria bacterium]MDH4032860.1 sigma-54 dependent transcriptional regulator [candidate division Zixibacteria bacterium]
MGHNKNGQSLSILIVDDEHSVRDSLTKWFKEFGYTVEAASDATKTLQKLRRGRWDIALLDVKLPGMDGIELNRKLKEIDPDLTTIMITAYASVDTAVKSLKDGADDYVTKPIDPDYLVHLVSRIGDRKRLQTENVQLKERIQELYEYDQIIGDSPAIHRVHELVRAVAPTDTTVMIRGESGTGKELIARSIHSASPRRFFPIITINCGGLTPGLTESEFFGHEKGAFTGAVYRRKGKLEMANTGTVFLDEIGNIDAKTQSDLLRVIETKQFTRVGGNEIINVDFRLICATNSNLEHAVEKGEFREDLYYRLNVFSVQVPPLRERRSDIPILANHFLKKLASSMNKAVSGFSEDALTLLTNHDWPGNVRELHNAIERAVVVAEGPKVAGACLPILNGKSDTRQGMSMESVERIHIQKVLDQSAGNVTHAADILQIDRTTLYHKIEKYGLRR